MSKTGAAYINLLNKETEGKLRFCFDIDGTLFTGPTTSDHDYNQSQPMHDMIKVVNWLFDNGHTIILHTARGGVSGKDWEELTKQQLQTWGVQHHKLVMGKPAADYYVDDRGITPRQMKEWGEILMRREQPASLRK